MRRRELRDYYGSHSGGHSGGKSGFSIRKQRQTDGLNIGLKSLAGSRNSIHIAAANAADREDAESQQPVSHDKGNKDFTVEDSTDRGRIQFVSPGAF